MVKGLFSGVFSPTWLYQRVSDTLASKVGFYSHSVIVCAWEGPRLEGHKYLFHVALRCPMNYDLLRAEPPGMSGDNLESFREEVRSGELNRHFLKFHFSRRKEDRPGRASG